MMTENKKSSIEIGEGCHINLVELLRSRMLINANSGGGKSWLLRRLLEQTHGQVQQILIDLEGEFSTLREKYDYLLVGKCGEIPISIKTAEILARRLLEVKVSTIIDLSELKHPERIIFVKRFLDALINLPQELWNACLVVVDEAHQFCPESSKSESAGAVIDLMTRGRKRGFCGILATQRISKLNKDAVAECNNYMMGRTFLDIDMKRASEILGFTSKEKTQGLRDLKPGEYYCFGSAFSHPGIEKTSVGKVATTHLDRTKGIDSKSNIKTPENIKKILKDVSTLAQEADEELRTISDLKRKVQELKTKLTLAEKGVARKLDEKEIERIRNEAQRQERITQEQRIKEIFKGFSLLEHKISQIKTIVGMDIPNIKILTRKDREEELPSKSATSLAIAQRAAKEGKIPMLSTMIEADSKLRVGAMNMLNWLAGAYPNNLTKQRLATLSGFSAGGGTFNTYLSELKRKGWIEGSDVLTITEEGLKFAQPKEMPSGDQLLELWMSKFRQGAASILKYLYEQYPAEVSKEDVGAATGFEASGGTFNTYISELRRNGLIEVSSLGIKISEDFFQ